MTAPSDPTGGLEPIRQIAHQMEEDRRKAATDLRALAARVVAEEPSEELRIAVMEAIGQPTCEPAMEEDGTPSRFVFLEYDPLTSHDAAFRAMPAGWRILAIEQTDEGYTARIGRGIFIASNCYTPVADLPRAVTAAGLLARAAEMEQGGNHG